MVPKERNIDEDQSILWSNSIIQGLDMKKKIFTTEFITKVGILAAIEVVFAFVSQFIKIGPASINLALIPIAFGAIMFVPISF